jgi:histidine ammonia-lyase
VKIAKNTIRKHVDFLDVDRPLYDDHNKMKTLVQSNEILFEVENCVGELH